MMLSKKNSEALENFSEKLEVEGRSLWQDARRRFMHNRAAVASLVVLVLIALFVTLAPMLSQFTYFDTDWGMMSSFSLMVSKQDMQGIYQTGPDSTGQVLIYLKDGVNLAKAEEKLRKGLEAKGYISVERYQQARTVAICGTNLSTAEPKHRTKHWRNRKRFTRAELEDHIADRVSEEVSFAAIAREIGFSVQHVRNVWADIRRQLGWQAA